MKKDDRAWRRSLLVVLLAVVSVCCINAPQPAIAQALSISKSPDGGQITAGATATFTIVVANNGPGTATAVTLSDPLPSGGGVIWTTGTAGCSIGGAVNAQILTCNFGNVAQGASVTAVVSAVTSAAACTTMINTALASATNVPPVQDSGSITCTAGAPIQIAPATLPAGTVGAAYNQTLFGIGGVPPFTFAVTQGSLPGGLALSPQGVISGTPTASGQFNFTVTATDSVRSTGFEGYTIIIFGQSLTAITKVSGDNQVGQPNSLLPVPLVVGLTDANGNPVPGVTVSWSLTSGTGTLSSPTSVVTNVQGQASVSLTLGSETGPRTVQATVAAAPAFTVTFTETASPAIVITPLTLPNGTLGVPYNQMVSATGGVPPFTFTVTQNALPNGLTLNSQSGVISGTPTLVERFGFTVAATDSIGSRSGRDYTILIDAASPPTGLSALSGDKQLGQAGKGLPVPLVVRLTDANGNPAPNVTVTWALTSGSGTLSSQSSVTDTRGQASVNLTLGPEAGPRTVAATVGGLSVTFVIRSAETEVFAPVQQTATIQQQVAIGGTRTQIANIQTRLDQLRMQRNPAVAQGLMLSYDGQPLPWQLLAQAATPTRSDATPTPSDPFERNNVFVQGNVEVGHQNTVSTGSGFDLRTKGLTLGADRRFDGNNVLGGALGLMRADTTVRDDGGAQDAKGYSFSVYGAYTFAETGYLNLIAVAGHNDYDGHRNLRGGTSVSSSTASTQYGAALSVGYDLSRDAVTFGPYGRVEYVHARINAFSENGDPNAALNIGEQSVGATFLTAGGQANWAIPMNWGILQPNARLEWQYQSSGSSRAVNAQLISVTDGSLFAVPIAAQDKSYGVGSIGVQLILPRSMQAYFNFETPFGKSNYSGQRYTLGVSIGF